MSEHSPLPWRMAGKGTVRGSGQDCWVGTLHWRDRDANAALIVKAVNSHDALVAFARYVLEIHPESDAPLFAKARDALASVKEHSK